jgi:hypothetical protein
LLKKKKFSIFAGDSHLISNIYTGVPYIAFGLQLILKVKYNINTNLFQKLNARTQDKLNAQTI